MDRKINYFLGTWSGKRQGVGLQTYLRQHIGQLNKIKHNLAHVACGYPHNPQEDPEYTKFITELKNLDDGTPVTVHPMSNIGYSYSQYSRMFAACKDQGFTHHIFCEDDYVPYKDHFDTILADMFDERHLRDNCGFLCGLILDETGRYDKYNKHLHAGISNGITNQKVLAKIYDEQDCLPHLRVNGMPEQVTFSHGFLKSGFMLQEYLDQFKCMYYQHAGNHLRLFGDQNTEHLIVPIQFLDHPCVLEVKHVLFDQGGHYQRVRAKSEGESWPIRRYY